MYLGSSKAATINLLGPGPKGPYAGNLSETLFFSDATGTMTSNWNGKRIETSGTVAVGPIACPTPKP
jgi:hypothetical protein